MVFRMRTEQSTYGDRRWRVSSAADERRANRLTRRRGEHGAAPPGVDGSAGSAPGRATTVRASRASCVMIIVAAALMHPFGGGDVARAQEAPGARRPQNAARVDTTITIRARDTSLEFLPSRISAERGTRVRIRFVNDGTLPHNIVLVKDENDIDMLGLAAFEAADTEYVPLEHQDRMFAYSDLAAPGETVEMTFEAPPAGEYFFVCLYSGHYNMMVGTLRSLERARSPSTPFHL